MRNLGCAVVVLIILVGAVFCAFALHSSGYVTAQTVEDAGPTDAFILNPTETPFPYNTTAIEPTLSPPTPSPTPVIDPGSPLSVGGDSLEEALARFDIISLAEMILVALGVIWLIIILVTVVRKLDREEK